MHTMVVIDMQNPNALISMAYVSENAGNPFAVFCEFIKYCIFTNSSEYMRLSDIIESVSKEFGLLLPHNVILNCLTILKKDGSIIEERYQIKRVGSFDAEKFDAERTAFREKETTLINELIKYVGKFNLTWSKELARKQLINVLDGDGLAYDIFFRQKEDISVVDDIENDDASEGTITDIDASDSDKENETQTLFSNNFYVAKFVEELLKSDSILTDYVKKICEGLMISIGAYQIPSSDSLPSVAQIKGTTFYFDTRLLLRYVGCANEVAVKATQELVSLIQSGGGIVAYFPHTLQEMENALDEAVNCLYSGKHIKDYEMMIYASKINYNCSVITAKRANLVYELEQSGIVLRQLQNHSDSDKLRFGFSYDDLLSYMKNSLDWDQRTIENDALSIWETHMNRNGNYRDYCGTNDRLCVFVTSNAKLIEISLAYRKSRPNTTSISGWKINRLPVITDVRLTCRLWNPATQVERFSMLRLTANVVAAQHPTQLYINKIKSLAAELQKNVPEYSHICLSEYFDDEITNRIFEKTEGQEENLNIVNFAGTIEEFSEMKAKEQEKLTKKEREEKEDIKTQFEEQKNAIIEGAVDTNKNKLGMCRLYLYGLLHWSVFITIIFVGISAAISGLIGDWHWLLLIAIPIGVSIIEQFISSNYLLKKMLKKALPKIEEGYEEKIKKQLKIAEKPYEKEIVEKVKEQTDILAKCKKILKE